MLTHGHATVDNITAAKLNRARLWRWDKAWTGARGDIQIRKDGEPWQYILIVNGIVRSINGQPLVSLIPTVIRKRERVPPRAGYWRISVPIEGEITARTLADSRRRYGINFEDVAPTLGQSNPKNEDWRRELRAITRNCPCRVCLMAKWPILQQQLRPRISPPVPTRPPEQDCAPSVRSTPDGGWNVANEFRRSGRLRSSVGFYNKP
ncbi:MAG: hypothetical protein DMG89_16700 [Acidobacteria bacterium]|nr:MAG: hypothetical protein DMG89_16700 [Acidobacteriota bacterium]